MNRIKVLDGRIDTNRYWENLSLNNIDGEVWKPVTFFDGKFRYYDFTGFYEVSNKCRIKSLKRIDCRGQHRHEKILKQDENGTYLRVMLSIDTLKLRPSVHRMVLFAFKTGFSKEKKYANHINAIRTDNRPENLEWVSGSENIKHAYTIGTKKISGAFKTAASRKGYLNVGSKGVIQIDVNTESVIATFSCAREAAESVGGSREAISQCLLGNIKTSAGFKWKRP